MLRVCRCTSMITGAHGQIIASVHVACRRSFCPHFSPYRRPYFATSFFRKMGLTVSVYKRKSGRWAVLIDLEPTATGGRRRRSIGTYATRKDAERAERAALSQRDLGIEVSPRTVTIASLLERYMSDSAARLQATTKARYRTLIDKLIVPHLGEMTLARTRPAHLAEWMTTLRARGGHKGKALSAKTCRHAFVLLSTAWRWAIRMQFAAVNPLAAVAAPSVSRSRARALSAGEIARVWRQRQRLAGRHSSRSPLQRECGVESSVRSPGTTSI